MVVNSHIAQVNVLHIASILDQPNTVYMYSAGLDKTLVVSNFKVSVSLYETYSNLII